VGRNANITNPHDHSFPLSLSDAELHGRPVEAETDQLELAREVEVSLQSQ
jgi:hypothetical protein